VKPRHLNERSRNKRLSRDVETKYRYILPTMIQLRDLATELALTGVLHNNSDADAVNHLRRRCTQMVGRLNAYDKDSL
jgi:hypothetical protein